MVGYSSMAGYEYSGAAVVQRAYHTRDKESVWPVVLGRGPVKVERWSGRVMHIGGVRQGILDDKMQARLSTNKELAEGSMPITHGCRSSCLG